jgi:hypothetical protein
MPGCFGFDQSFFDSDGDGSNSAMAAHGQAAAGFDKQNGHIIGRIMWGIQNTSAHHIMTTGLKHQPLRIQSYSFRKCWRFSLMVLPLPAQDRQWPLHAPGYRRYVHRYRKKHARRDPGTGMFKGRGFHTRGVF